MKRYALVSIAAVGLVGCAPHLVVHDHHEEPEPETAVVISRPPVNYVANPPVCAEYAGPAFDETAMSAPAPAIGAAPNSAIEAETGEPSPNRTINRLWVQDGLHQACAAHANGLMSDDEYRTAVSEYQKLLAARQ